MGDVEYRRIGVVVDGDNLLAVAHAGLMLNRPADARGDIQNRPHGRAGLADLVVAVNKAQVNSRTGRAGRCTQAMRQVPDEFEIVFAADAGAAGDDDARGLEVDFALLAVSASISMARSSCDRCTVSLTTCAFLLTFGVGMGITPSRTVAICGQRS